MSEGTAIALVWWYLWSLALAKEKQRLSYSILPLFLFGLLMGIRLSFLPFGIGILLLWFYEWRMDKNKFYKRLILYIVLAILFQLIWVMGLMMSEGSIAGFFQLALGFVGGHFNEWGGAVTAEETSISERFFQFLFYNLLWVGLAGQSVYVAILLGLIGLLLFFVLIDEIVVGKGRERRKSSQLLRLDSFVMWLVLCLSAYFIWAFFAQNVAKPRHIAALVSPIYFLLFTTLLTRRQYFDFLMLHKRNLLLQAKYSSIIGYSLIVCLLLLQTFLGVTYAKKQAEDLPATYQLHHHLMQIEENFIIYTWEETRVLQYLQAPYAHKRILTYDFFQEELKYKQQQKVFLTNHVLDGFEAQAGDLSDRVKKITTFYSDPLFDPVYHEITYYQWIH